jgi:glycosyltransferase involved in cell wall biosynthesis
MDPVWSQYKLAKAWRNRGRMNLAEDGFRKVLDLDSDHAPALIELGILLLERQSFAESEQLFIRAWKLHPNDCRCHKGLLAALSGQNALEKAFACYRLEKKDCLPTRLGPGEILCCAAVRNELTKLPFFLEFYRERGVDRFFFIDNGSSDGSVEFLLTQPGVNVWSSPLSFRQSNFGAGWFEVLLRSYATGHWVLLVDADELLVYPDYETKRLRELCRELEQRNKCAFDAVLLDMYSDKTVAETLYQAGQSFIEVCPYFDRAFYNRRIESGGPFKNQISFFGGVRERIFGMGGNYYLSKVPLIQYDTDCLLSGGQHWTNLSRPLIADDSGCLLHFKFFVDFDAYVREQVIREEHYENAVQYKEYLRRIESASRLGFFDPRYSVRFKDSRQLVEMGIMRRRGG